MGLLKTIEKIYGNDFHMDLWQLKIFKAVIDLEGFSRAAEAIHLTQPTVSSHIRDLEAHFGCRLIDRMGKTAKATRAGELLYEYADRMLKLAAETESAVAEFLGHISGQIAIGGSTIPGGYILPRQIGGFTRIYPEVRIRLHVSDTRQIIDEVLAGRLDFGMVGAEAESGHIVQKALIRDEMRLIVRADHPWADHREIELNRLCSQPFLLREPGSGTRKSLEQQLARAGLSMDGFTVAAELGSTASVIQGIKSGMGISILSPIAVEDERKSGSLKALAVTGLDLSRHFYLTTRRERTPSPASRALMDYLEKQMAPA
ncbi:MAG: selenium metabolism-associated LysR family transcriptional regulator [Desulfosalsimonas sp.]|uniref:selenium metabolism-associated LysR family transcriptional regulator n=1 Tax=Desulfosalsimonas sp. TaxID=3073848 RepID=UPI003970EA87